MGTDLWLLLALIAVGAGWFSVHVALLMRTFRSARLPIAVRALVLLPPATPVVGWLAGCRLAVSLWAALGLLYLCLWLLS